MENFEDHTTEIKKRTQPLLDVFSERTVSEVRQYRLFCRFGMNCCRNKRGRFVMVEKELEPVFLKMLDRRRIGFNKVGPDRFVVPDDQLNSLDGSAVFAASPLPT